MDKKKKSEEIKEEKSTDVILGNEVTPESNEDSGQARMTKSEDKSETKSKHVEHKPHKLRLIDKEISRKTFILSQLFIIITGLIFVFGFNFLVNQGFRSDFIDKYNPVTKAPSSFNLEINNPDDEVLVFDKNIVLTGKTGPQSSVIVKLGDQTFAVEATKLGDFNKVLNLNIGLNNLEIVSFDDKGNTKTVFRTIYFSEEKI